MKLRDMIDYYSREDVQNALLKVAKNREVVGVFRNGSFSKRPNTIVYPQDIISMIRHGVQEFHCSLERWSQPMAIRHDNHDNLRIGWDLILDLDCKLFEHGKAAAVVFCDALQKHDIKNFSVKFTGGKGFHIGIPWESMPEKINYEPIAKQYPELARNIALYLKDFARESLEKKLLKKFGNPEKIAESIKKPLNEILVGAKANETFDPYAIVDVDPVLISPRHLFRMPYSLNKSSGLVSLPLQKNQLEDFEKSMAEPQKVKPDIGFLDRAEPGESEGLFGEAIDWHTRTSPKRKKIQFVQKGPLKAIKKEYFPPCIQNISNGLQDGKKRSVFVLINFLSSAGWKKDDIEGYLLDWNQKNSPPLRENYIRMQIRWHQSRIKSGQKAMPPPGCNKAGYYESYRVCTPDTTCGGSSKKIKNPLSYSLRKIGIKKPKRKSVQYKSKNKSNNNKKDGG